MFRLKEQQLHMLMWLMVGASIVMFVIFGWEQIPKLDEKSSWKGMDGFSEGWICNYETYDEDKLAEYRKEHGIQVQEQEKGKEDATVVEVVTFPNTITAKKDTILQLTRQVPEMSLETAYVIMELDNADVRVLVDDTVVYDSNEKGTMTPTRHVIPIPSQFENGTMTIRISGFGEEGVALGRLMTGSYNQLWVTTLQADGVTAVIGLVLLLFALCMLVVWKVTKNTWQQKKLLFYSTLEGALFGVLMLLSGEVISLITGWNVGIYLMKACGILLAIILHLTIVRCFIYKKKVLTIVDIDILLVGVFYISVMVLQAFSLMQFDTIYRIGLILYVVMVVLFTIVLAVTIFDYRRKEGMPVFVANVLLMLCMLVQGIVLLIGREGQPVYVCVGIVLYMAYIWVYGMKQAFYVVPKKEELPVDEGEIRAKMLEQLNPNLLFAAFQTLQSLMKNGSGNSMKMLYYISVYFRDNIKALEHAGETIPFEEELEHMIAYLQLQKTRNQNLEFAIECKTKEFQIPRHSLQPLLENAVKHGIAGNGNKGTVAIRAYTRVDGYGVQIIDDGAGFDTAILRKKNSTIAKKLLLLETTCQAKTEVISKQGKGTVITIVLPMLENDLLSDEDDLMPS